jgi:hypothetical protein
MLRGYNSSYLAPDFRQSTKSFSPASNLAVMWSAGQWLETGEDVSLEEAKQIAAELSTLAKAQREALQKAPYARMSNAEREAYDRRRAHIGQLNRFLVKLRPKAEDAG